MGSGRTPEEKSRKGASRGGDLEGTIRKSGEDQQTRREQCPKFQEQRFEKAEVISPQCRRRPGMGLSGAISRALWGLGQVLVGEKH